MKYRKWVITIGAISLIFVLFIAFMGIIAIKGFGISTGRYLQAKNGTAMVVLDNSPIQMSNRAKEDLFDDLDTGDKILVIHDGIAETYPGKTGVYAVFKLSQGTSADIPQRVVEELTELGWY